MIAAYLRAQALRDHARYLGASLDEFVVVLTDREAWELLDDMQAQLQLQGGSVEFEQDYAAAKAANTPWKMINEGNLHVMDMQVCRREGEIN